MTLTLNLLLYNAYRLWRLRVSHNTVTSITFEFMAQLFLPEHCEAL